MIRIHRSPFAGCPWDAAAARVIVPVALWLAALGATVLQTGCTASSLPTERADLGRPVSAAVLERALEQPGPIAFERIVVADWVVDRSGLINLDHPEAERQGIEAGPEPIEI